MFQLIDFTKSSNIFLKFVFWSDPIPKSRDQIFSIPANWSFRFYFTRTYDVGSALAIKWIMAVWSTGSKVFKQKHLCWNTFLSKITSYTKKCVAVGAVLSMHRFSSFWTFWKPFDPIQNLRGVTFWIFNFLHNGDTLLLYSKMYFKVA